MSQERLRREDLERFHDGELEGAERERVAERLREDPEARARLARVRDVDAMTRGALTGEKMRGAAVVDGGTREVVARVGWGRGVWSAAAVVVVVAGVTGVRWVRSLPPVGSPAAQAGVAREDPVESLRRRARSEGVLVLRVEGAGERTMAAAGEETDASLPASKALLALVGEGSLAEAFDAARSNPEALSDHVMAALGERVRSGDLAREFLESLPAERRADAVRVWAGNPRLRPAAFDQLREMLRSSDEAWRLAGERALVELSDRPELATWIASYAHVGR